MIYKYCVRSKNRGAEIADVQRRLHLKDLELWRDYYVETADPISAEQVQQLGDALSNPFLEEVSIGLPLAEGRMVQITHQLGIVDNESASVIALGETIGVNLVAVKVGTTYESTDAQLVSTVRSNIFNESIHELHTREPKYATLQPSGQHVPMRSFDLLNMSDAELVFVGTSDGRNLDLRQMRSIADLQREAGTRYVTDVLLEALDARWSDHCAHTTWKSLGHLLRRLEEASRKTGNPNIVTMFHDNAGVWDFYENTCLAFKAETHNGPTAISAYFGQLTKLGGVLRDIMGTGLGADPIGVFEYSATGLLDSDSFVLGRPSARRIACETIEAIKEYGNTFGAPMLWSHMAFHHKYRAKPFALGGAIGLIPKQYARRGEPEPGDLVVLIGALTGNDGIHGASASSAGGDMDYSSVQIGSPLEQIKFRSAIMELRDARCIRAVTDVGGAGLNSAVGEMGEACGVWINLALVPLKTAGLPGWRILVSESQERMVLALIPSKLEQANEILAKHGVRSTVIGKFTGTQRYCVIHDRNVSQHHVVASDASSLPLSGEIGIDVPYRRLDDEPDPRVPVKPRLRERVPGKWPEFNLPELEEFVAEMLRDQSIVDQSYAGCQYDSTVRGQTFYGPYFGRTYRVPTSYCAVTPLYDRPFAAVFSATFNPWLFEIDPVLATRQGFLGLLSKLVLAGVDLKDICICDNFYTPDLEESTGYYLNEMVNELAALVGCFGTPIISGKDSSAGSTKTSEGIVSVPPAVLLSGLGKVTSCSSLIPNEWQQAGNVLVRLGPNCGALAGTLTARLLNKSANELDDLDVAEYRQFLLTLSDTCFVSGVPIDVGGVLARVILNALGSRFGVELYEPSGSLHELLLEHRCGVVVEFPADRVSAIPDVLQPTIIGQLTTKPQSVSLMGRELLGESAVRTWNNSFRESLT